MTVSNAAASGSRLAALEALRDVLADAIDEATPNMLPQIAGQLRATLAEIGELTAGSVTGGKETGLSDFEKRLRERESGAKVPRKAKSS